MSEEPYEFWPGAAWWRQQKAMVLLEVSENPGMDHEELSEKLGLTLSVVVKIMGELVDAGILVYTEKD